MPVLHGTSGTVAWKIAQNAFSTLSSLDAGYYGNGTNSNDERQVKWCLWLTGSRHVLFIECAVHAALLRHEATANDPCVLCMPRCACG